MRYIFTLRRLKNEKDINGIICDQREIENSEFSLNEKNESEKKERKEKPSQLTYNKLIDEEYGHCSRRRQNIVSISQEK